MATVQYITKPCMVCGKTTGLTLDLDKVQLWRDGALVQNVWPEWTPGERELLITGTHDECWDAMFSDEEKM